MFTIGYVLRRTEFLGKAFFTELSHFLVTIALLVNYVLYIFVLPCYLMIFFSLPGIGL